MNSRKEFHLRPRRKDGPAEGGGIVARAMHFVRSEVWLIDVADLSKWRATFTRGSRVMLIAGRGFVRDRCLQQSAALTYLTIFTLPAFLALVFAVAKGLNVFERLRTGPIERFITRAFPSNENEGSIRLREVVDIIFHYVEGADVRALSAVGVLFLVYATIKMLGSVERALNETWGVQRARTLVRKFSDYLAIVIITPIVLLVGTALTGFLKSAELRSWIGETNVSPAVTAAAPLVATCLGMTLVLLTLPNTRVNLVPAAVGGCFAAVIWQVSQYAFVEFQLGLTQANAIFAGFAAVPLLLSWIYLSWMSVFIGAQISFAIQNESTITSIARIGTLDQSFREALAPRLAGRVAAAFVGGDPAPNAVQLAADLGLAPRAIASVLDALVRHRILVETSEDCDEGYLPARDPATITMLDLLQAQRHDEHASDVPSSGRLDERVDRILAGFEETLRDSLYNYTLLELAQSVTEASPADGVTEPALRASAPATDPPVE